MIDTRNTNGDSHNTNLVEIVQNMLKSKIQYIEHEQDYLSSSNTDLDLYSEPLLSQIHSPNQLKSIKSRLDDFIMQYEKLSHSRELLLLIKPLVKEETAHAIYELLSNDKYLFYSPSMLQRLLNLEVYMAENFYSISES